MVREEGSDILGGNWGRPRVEGGASGKGGARIVIRLAADVEPIADVQPGAEKATAPGRSFSILVVEDEPRVARSVMVLLVREGHRVELSPCTEAFLEGAPCSRSRLLSPRSPPSARSALRRLGELRLPQPHEVFLVAARVGEIILHPHLEGRQHDLPGEPLRGNLHHARVGNLARVAALPRGTLHDEVDLVGGEEEQEISELRRAVVEVLGPQHLVLVAISLIRIGDFAWAQARPPLS